MYIIHMIQKIRCVDGDEQRCRTSVDERGPMDGIGQMSVDETGWMDETRQTSMDERG